jgi:hypothetical protein
VTDLHALYGYGTPDGEPEPTTGDFMAGNAVSGPLAAGPSIVRAGDTIPALAAKLYRRGDLVNPVADLTDGTLGKKFLDQLNDTGSGSIDLPNDSPAIPLIGEDDLIRFEVNGWAAQTILVNDVERHTVGSGEEAEEMTTLSGPGHLSVMSEAIVYPSNGLGVLPVEDNRLFNWTAFDFNDLFWGPSYGITKYSTPGTYWSYAGIQRWPDPDAYWMWRPSALTGARLDWEPPGPCYFRRFIDVPEGATTLVFYSAFDDYGDIYLDGVNIATGEFGPNPMMTGRPRDRMNTYKDEIEVTPGRHIIAAYVENGLDPEWNIPGEAETQNPGALLFSCYVRHGAEPQEWGPIMRSDSSWRCLPYPPTPPGMTPGEALIHCLHEAQRRGALIGVTFAFNEAVDSDGNPWPVVGDIATKVGTDLLTFLRELAATYIDFWMEPASMTLHAWIKDGRGALRNVTLRTPTDPDDPATGNLITLDHHRTQGVTDSLLVRWAEGWREVARPSGVRREAVLGLGAQESAGEADRLANGQLDVFADPRTAITAELDPSGTNDVPYLHFRVGDTITVPDHTGAPIQERVIAMTVDEDDDGYLTYQPELGDLILPYQERFQQALKKMENGTLQGDSEIATPISLVPKVPMEPLPPEAYQPEIVFSLSGAVTLSSSPPWVRRSDGTLVEVVGLLGTPGSGPTTVNVLRNGVVAHTLTIPAGQTRQVDTGLFLTYLDTADTLTDQVTAAGAGATDLTILHRFRF